jgi:hypothetical protein
MQLVSTQTHGLNKSRPMVKYREEAQPPLKHVAAWKKRTKLGQGSVRKEKGGCALAGQPSEASALGTTTTCLHNK